MTVRSSGWIPSLFSAGLVLVAVLLIGSQWRATSPDSGPGQGAGAATSAPAATGNPSPSPEPEPTSSVPFQMGHNGQEMPQGPSDEIGGEHDIPCPNGEECP